MAEVVANLSITKGDVKHIPLQPQQGIMQGAIKYMLTDRCNGNCCYCEYRDNLFQSQISNRLLKNSLL